MSRLGKSDATGAWSTSIVIRGGASIMVYGESTVCSRNTELRIIARETLVPISSY